MMNSYKNYIDVLRHIFKNLMTMNLTISLKIY